MKNHLLITFLVLTQMSVLAQKEDCTWVVGNGASNNFFGMVEIRFDGNGQWDTVRLDESKLDFGGTTSSISNSNGDRIMSFDGVHLEGADLEMIDTLETWTYHGNYSPQSGLILPYPSEPNKYIVFHETEGLSGYISKAFNYSVVDMSLNNGKGKVIVKKVNLITDTLVGGRMMAARHANGRDWWLIIPEKDSNKYYKILVGPNGPVLTGEQSIGISVLQGVGNATFSTDGSKYIMFNSIGVELGQNIDIYDFDRCTGVLSNHQRIHLNQNVAGGVAVSSDSRFLYVASLYRVHQYDLWASNVEASGVVIGEMDVTWHSSTGWSGAFYFPVLAPDGRIYISATGTLNKFHIIEDPNKKGLGCNLRQHGFDLPTRSRTVPNFPNFRLGSMDGSSCDTLGIDNHSVANWSFSLDSTDYKTVYFRDFSYYSPEEWHWDFGDGTTSTDTEPTHVYSMAGTYPVCLTVSNGNSSNTVCQDVQVDSSMIVYPSAEIIIDSIYGCTPDSVRFHAVTTNTNHLLWEYATGMSVLSLKGDTTNSVTAYFEEGVYNYRFIHLRVTNDVGSTSYNKPIKLHDAPVIDFKIVNPLGIQVYFQNKCSGVDNTYSWDFGDGTTNLDVDNSTQVHYYEELGTFEITLSLHNDVCGDLTMTKYITIDSASIASGSGTVGIIRDTLTSCTPLTVKYHADLYSVDSIDWVFEGGIPSTSKSADVIVTYSTIGEYETTLNVYSYLNQNSTVTKTIPVFGEAPTSDFEMNPIGLQLSLNNQSNNSTSFFWDFGDGTTDTTSSPVHTFAQAGNYDIILIASNDCGDDTLSRNLIITDIELLEKDMGYAILPNPSTGLFTLEAAMPLTGKMDISVYNLLGQVVLRKQVPMGVKKMEIDLRKQVDGVYWYRVDYLGKVGFGQLVKME